MREHVLPWRGDTSRVAELASILVDQGIEVRRSTRALTACKQELPAGSVFVSTAQPAGRFARTLLETGADMQERFVREQERRRRKSLPHEMYDITAWSLPLLFGVEQVPCGEAVAAGSLEPVTRGDAPPSDTGSASTASRVWRPPRRRAAMPPRSPTWCRGDRRRPDGSWWTRWSTGSRCSARTTRSSSTVASTLAAR